MNLSDFHTHAFVDSLAGHAVSELAETSSISSYTEVLSTDCVRLCEKIILTAV